MQGPFQTARRSVQSIMYDVLIALCPAVITASWLLSPRLLLDLLLCSLLCVVLDALYLTCRGLLINKQTLLDGSSLITVWLIVLSLPMDRPWWLLLLAIAIGLIFGKYVYGGLGQNPFNPAMLAYAACLIAFPALMSHWPHTHANASLLVQGIPIDGVVSATPIDHMKTQLHQHISLLAQAPLTWTLPDLPVHIAYLIGGLYLLARQTIRYVLPTYFLIGLMLPSTALWLYEPASYASPLFHLLHGATLMAAFFIITDPVSGPRTPKAQCLLGLLAGALTYMIRVFGGYPDGVAFAILIMNMLSPLIDRLTPPAIFGHTQS